MGRGDKIRNRARGSLTRARLAGDNCGRRRGGEGEYINFIVNRIIEISV